MRMRIIIDTQDAGDPGAFDKPFTLSIYQDDEDGTPSREPLEIGTHGSALVGDEIDTMLNQLANVWKWGLLTDQNGDVIPVDANSWRASLEPKTPTQVAEDVMNASYGPGSNWSEPNEFDETGFTRAQAESDIDTEEILGLIQKAIEVDRAQRPEQPSHDRAQPEEDPTPQITLTAERIHAWTGYRPSPEQMKRLATCLPHSSVPEAIGTILSEALGLFPDHEGDAL